MVELVKSKTFDLWLRALRDFRARAKIEARMLRLAMGNPGDVRPVGGGISEMRIDYGPGYRVNYLQQGSQLVVLLCGGDKARQQQDIESAAGIAAEWQQQK